MNAAGYADAVIGAVDGRRGEELSWLFSLSALSPQPVSTPCDGVLMHLRSQRVSLCGSDVLPAQLIHPILAAPAHPIRSRQVPGISRTSLDRHLHTAARHCTAALLSASDQPPHAHDSLAFTRLWP